MQKHFVLGLTLLISSIPLMADSVYIDASSADFSAVYFGTIDLKTGAFHQVGPNAPPEGLFGLVGGDNGTLIALTYASNLERFNPATGLTTLIGATGLGDCATVTSPCGPTSGATIGGLAGKIYATDFQNSLYGVNPATGKATLIGSTGMPGLSFVPGSTNPDGTFNFYDEAIFGFEGKLYVTFDAFVFDPNTGTTQSVITPGLYELDPATAKATLVGLTDQGIGTVVNVGGTLYAFNDLDLGIYTLDAGTGKTTFTDVRFDPAAGVIQGAWAATPEPGSIALVGMGILLVGSLRKGRPITNRPQVGNAMSLRFLPLCS
jgi:hypothetical protein